MFADPQSITVNSVAQSLPRVLIDGSRAVYKKSDESFTLSISHQVTKDKRIRSTARFEQRGIVTNPLDSSNDYDTQSISVQLDRPNYGFSMAQVEQLVAAFTAWLTVGNVDKIYGQEI